MVGIWRFWKEIPKNPRTKDKMKKAKNAITRPTTADMIVPRAASTLDLSPPEVIHLIPPQMRKKRATIEAITSIVTITVFIACPGLAIVRLQRLANPPGG